MSQNITPKIAAVAVAIIMNGVMLGGIGYLFSLRSYAAPASVQCQSQIMHVRTAIV